MFRLIAIDFSQKSPHFSLLSPTSPCELSEREVTSPSNLKVVGALDNYSLVFVIFDNFFGQLKDWVRQVLFSSPDPLGQVSYCHHWASVVCRPSVNFSHFYQLLWSHWANLNQTLVEWSLDGPLPKLCPVIPTSNQDGRQAKNRKKGGWNFNCSLLL